MRATRSVAPLCLASLFVLSLTGGSAAAPVTGSTSSSGSATVAPPASSLPFSLIAQIRKIVAPDGQPFDNLGFAVDISGGTAVVGAPFDDDRGASSGAAYVFERDRGGADNWGLVRKLRGFAGGDNFGFDVAIDGDTILVGVPGRDTRVFNTTFRDVGEAVVFIRHRGGPDNWGAQQTLIPPSRRIGDRAGYAVDVSDEVVVIGSPFRDDFGTSSGRAYVYERSPSGLFTRVKDLAAADPAAADQFGRAVAASRDTIVVGAPLHDHPAPEGGAIYFFERDEGGADNWGLRRERTNDEAFSRLGLSVAIHQHVAAAGVPFEDIGGIFTPRRPDVGAIALYGRDRGGPGNWGLEHFVTGASNFGRLGVAVDIGAAGAVAGSASINRMEFVERRADGVWLPKKSFHAGGAPASDLVGRAIALSNDVIIAGAVGDDDRATNAGAAYLFELANRAPIADAGTNQLIECGNPAGNQVILDGSLSSDPDGDPLTFTWTGPFTEGGGTVTGVMPTVTLPIGLHFIWLTVTDAFNETHSDTVIINVRPDTTAPVIASAAATPSALRPPNHKMTDVTVTVDVTDECDAAPSCSIVGVTSNEPINGTGDGDSTPDWLITGPLTLQLRAERAGSGNGRVYTLTIECRDASGNTSQKSVEVVVPLSQGGGGGSP